MDPIFSNDKTSQQNNEKYHTIKIQNLEKKSKPEKYETDSIHNWKCKKKCKCGDKGCNCRVLCYRENVIANSRIHQNCFFGAFLNAYVDHHDVILAPVDVWLVICFQFSQYVNKNSEILRTKLVYHKDTKILSVTTVKEICESQWDEFFLLMIEQIKNNTKNNIGDILMANFSTVTPVENILSALAVMDTFKTYFEYERNFLCGINNVHFLGTCDDWLLLIEKTKNLRQYDVNGVWTKYIDNLMPILHNFVDTYNGNVDVKFWNKIMDITREDDDYFPTSHYSGWILNFFGIYEKVKSDDIPEYFLDVQVKINNEITSKYVNLIGGFGGVHQTIIGGNTAFRPQSSMIVRWNGEIEQIPPLYNRLLEWRK